MLTLNGRATEAVHFVQGIAPVANAFAGTVSTQAVNMSLWRKCVFDYIKGVGATGTATIIVEACTSAAGAGNVAIPFTYRSYTTAAATSDVPTTVPTAATAAGFTTTAGSNQRYILEVDQANLLAVSGAKYVRLTSTEVAASPVLGGVEIMLMNPLFSGAANPTTVIT
jgi:hypothetical protein